MFENWRSRLERKLKKSDEEGEIEGLYTLICEVELGLSALNSLKITDLDALWVLLAGYDFPENQHYSQEQRRAIANARVYLTFGSYAWRDHLKEYMNIPPKWRLFKIEAGKVSREEGMTRVIERENEYAAALSNRPTIRIHSRTFPEPAIPVHFIHAGTGADIPVLLDEALYTAGKVTDEKIDRLPDSPILERQPIRISFADLKAYTLELNQRFGIDADGTPSDSTPGYARDWAKAINEIVRFRAVTKDPQDRVQLGQVNEGELIIDDVTHVAGMVGAGKSTLAELVAMFGVEKGNFRTTLIVGDAQTSLDLANQINRALGASPDQPIAVPLIGKTTRGEHYQKLRSSLPIGSTHWGETWLNPTCLLQGLIPLELIEEPLPQGSEPCERLQQKKKDTNIRDSSCECPFFSICPSRILDRQIPLARIWVTTPQAMMHSHLPVQIDQRRFLFAEMIYFYSDLVIFDEIDADQQVLDDTFAPERHLIKERSGDLGEADRYSAGWFGISPKNETYERRRRALSNAMTTADHLCNMLEDKKRQFLKEWTDKMGYISPAILFRSIADEINELVGSAPDADPENTMLFPENPIMKAFWAFQDMDKVYLPRVDTAEMRLLKDVLINSALGSNDETGPQQDAEAWITQMIKKCASNGQSIEIPKEKIVQLGSKLEMAVVLSALEYDLYELSHGYQSADEDDETNAPDFQNTGNMPIEFLSAIPASPLGSASGFRYTNDDTKQKGAMPARKSRQLLYFRFAGMGRYVLLNFSHLFADVGYPGPNTLCMSGTSWMEDSDAHHFAIEPAGILEASESAKAAIRVSEFKYSPQRDVNEIPIYISGSGNLEGELQKLAISLSRFPQVQQSLLSLVMNRLAVLGSQYKVWENRQRILILVNSYKQAKLVAQTIRDQIYLEKPDWEVYYLERGQKQGGTESEGQWTSVNNGTKALKRPELTRFGVMTDCPTVLVAPLLAVGRRHNILNDNKTAAFGAIFFATRPMKTPDDLSRWVSWINYQTTRLMQNPESKEWKGASTPKDRLLRIRSVMNGWWSRIGSYKGVSTINNRYLRRSLAATMAAIVVQATGRLLRGGVPFLAYFVDAAWAPQSANRLPDNPRNSLLIEMMDIVNEYCRTPIGEVLFGPLNEAFQQIEGVVREPSQHKTNKKSSRNQTSSLESDSDGMPDEEFDLS